MRSTSGSLQISVSFYYCHILIVSHSFQHDPISPPPLPPPEELADEEHDDEEAEEAVADDDDDVEGIENNTDD